MKRLLDILKILAKYKDGRLLSGRGYMGILDITEEEVFDKTDIEILNNNGCYFNRDLECWFINI